MFQIEVGYERARLDESKRTGYMLFLDGLTEPQCIDWTGLQPTHIRLLLFDPIVGAIANGLKKGHKLTAENKVILYLNHLRHNISIRALSICFKIPRSTLSRCIDEVENSLQPFAHQHTAIPSCDEIRYDLTTTDAASIRYRLD